MLPFINIFGLNIPMYGLMLAVGLIGGSCIAYMRARRVGLIGENLIIILACALGCAILGGGLLYVLVTYTPSEIIELIKAGKWNALAGIVFYGALIGGTLGALLGSAIAGDDIRNYLDVVVPVIPLGHAFGRIGCFCAGCCYGRPTDSAIGVVYTQAIGGAPLGVRLLPVQLFEASADVILFIILMAVSARLRSGNMMTNRADSVVNDGRRAAVAKPKSGYSTASVKDTAYNDGCKTAVGKPKSRNSTASLKDTVDNYGCRAAVAGIKSRYLTTCLYCILYGIARFILEFYRYDSIRGMAAGLSTSQWISIVFAAGGMVGLIFCCTGRRS
jgi:phosphatidylglycerol---prolipoprotein diacylglyceryl transferase